MKKRILSLLLCLVMCLSLMPTVAFAESQLPDPTNVRLSNDMMLTWEAVEGANEYIIKLIVEDHELGSSTQKDVGNISGTSIDLSSNIPSTKRNSRFSYIAQVRAINKSNNAMSNFSDSNKVSGADFGEQSTQYTITVNGGRAALNSSGERIIYGADPGETIYLIPTVPEGQEFDGWTVNTPSGLELSATLPAYFTMPSSNVEVTAKYEEIPITELPDPTNVRLSNDMMLTWEAVEGANEYIIKLIVEDHELGSSTQKDVGNISGTSIDLSSNIPSTKRNSRFSYIAQVRAINKSNNAMSDFSDSNKVSGADFVEQPVLPTMKNVQISPEGILSWDAVEGAAEYSVLIGIGGGLCTETTYNLKADCQNYGWESGTYDVKLYAVDSNGDPITEQWVGTYTYDASSVLPNTFTVSFNANGGSGTMASVVVPDTGTLGWEGYTVPDCNFTPPANKEFDVWEVVGENRTYAAGTYTTIFGNTELKALWKDATTPQPTTYTVTYDANGGTGTMNPEICTIDAEKGYADYVFPACGFTAPEGKEFDCWTVEGITGSISPQTRHALFGDMIVKAVWKDSTAPQPTTYTVSFEMNGHGDQVAAQTVNEGAKATKPADPAASGWTFDGWYADATFSVAFDFDTAINADTTIYAKWTRNTTPPTTTYTVSFNMNGHGNQVAAQTVNEGAKATKPTDPTASGWTFDGWYADATFSATFDFNTAINADTTIYAKWTQSTTPPTTTYTIIAGANGEWTKGSTTGLAFTSDAPFDKFDSVKVDGSTIAATNYTAEAGSTKITLAPAYLETMSVGSHSIVVVSTDGSASTNFTVKSAAIPPVPTTYTVTFNMNGHGTQITAQSVESGSKATKPADPKASGYTFGGWYADATCSTKFDFNSAITANTTVYAKWTKNSVAPTDPTTPQTGDNSNMFLWIALLFASGGALVGTAVYGKKKKYRAE